MLISANSLYIPYEAPYVNKHGQLRILDLSSPIEGIIVDGVKPLNIIPTTSVVLVFTEVVNKKKR